MSIYLLRSTLFRPLPNGDKYIVLLNDVSTDADSFSVKL